MAQFEAPNSFPDPDKVEEVKVETPDFEIEIEDDTPEEDRGRKPADPEKVKQLEVEVDDLDKYSKDAKDKLIRMKRVWNDERRRAESAERERQAAIEAAEKLYTENKRMRQMLTNGEQEYVAAVKNSSEMKLEMAKKAYREAYEAGDVDKITEAQQAITNATLQMDRANNFKMPPLQEEKFEVQPQQQRQQTVQQDPKLANWLDNNQWFQQDRGMTNFAMGVHEDLVDSGIVAGSDRYYAELDAVLRKRFPDKFEEPEEVEVRGRDDAPAKRASTVVAPVSRSTASKRVKLTTSQQAIAKRLGLTNEQYVRELLKVEN